MGLYLLGVVLLILFASVVASLVASRRERQAARTPQVPPSMPAATRIRVIQIRSATRRWTI